MFTMEFHAVRGIKNQRGECPSQAPPLSRLSANPLAFLFSSLRISIIRTKFFSDHSYKTLLCLTLQGLRIGHIVLQSFLKCQERIEFKGSNSLASCNV